MKPLEGTWEIAALAPGLVTDPTQLDAAHPEWMPCAGAMTAAAALRACGAWNLEQPRDFDADDWWYRCRFSPDVDGPFALRFEGLATVADVWLNGHHILHSESMFIAHTVDVAPGVSRTWELVLRFHALLPLLAPRRPRPQWRTRLVSHQVLRWYRTSRRSRRSARGVRF
jgi:beta-mannosidase